MNWFDRYDFGNWAMVKYPDTSVLHTQEKLNEYRRDKKNGLWPARTQETIQRLRRNT